MDGDDGLLGRVTANLDGMNLALRHNNGEAAVVFADNILADIPKSAEAWYWKASACMAAKDTAGAIAAMDVAVRSHVYDLFPALGIDIDRFLNDREYNNQLSHACYGNRMPAVASIFGMQAVSQGATDPTFLLHHGLSFQHQGRMDEAMRIFGQAAQAHPSAAVLQFYLYSLFFVPNGVQRYAVEAKAWGNAYGGFESWNRQPASLAGRRLRVGYVAPGILTTQLKQFLTPILNAHDPDNVEVILYVAKPETEAGLPCARMVATDGITDEALTQIIRADEVDVLIDTWGHTSGSRAGVFARRAAPVQVAWINFVQTTGIKAMDYVLHADSMAAPGTEELFVEKVWPIGQTTVPYRPAMKRMAPVPTPALASGIVTFASFNHPAKLSDETIAAWARILKGRDNSVLLLKYGYFADPVLQRVFRARFQAHGIDTGRILFEGHSLGDEYVQSFARIDLALDPSPCPGGTTTCDAMANGVPVLTLAGNDFYARIGIQVLESCGLPELITQTWDDYVEKAVALTADLGALDTLRARVRPNFDASSLCDAEGFTRNLENAFAEMTQLAMAAQAA